MIAEIVFATLIGSQPVVAPHSTDVTVIAQYEATRQGYRGTGDQFGRGWERDRKGTVRGTGRNFGGGFDADPKRKSYTGTGTRFGGGYDVGGRGNRIVGTGNNFGKGWERSGNEWVGTGGNFGKRCPARPGSTFVPCM